MKFKLPLLLLSSLMWQAAASANEWTNLATAVTVTEGYLCAGELALDGTGTDILCDTTQPYVDDDGNVGIGTASPANSLTVVGDISATTLNATQLCDETGANCTTLSGGISGASALSSLTDVNVSSPADTATLQWDNTSSKWVAGASVTGCSAGSTDVMPTMTSSSTDGHTVTASLESGSHYGWDAFDGSTGLNNKWFAGANSAILTIEFPTSTVLSKYKITATNEPGYENRLPKNWTFEGSADGSSWTVLDTQSNVTGWVSNGSKSFQFSNTTVYKYYRLNISSDNGASVIAIGEMELYEVTCSGADDLGNHTATQNLNMSTFDIIGTGEISVTTLNATQLCDETGANCTTLSDGVGVSTLASLTDVSATSPTEGQLLSYDASEGEWVATDVISKTIIYNSIDDEPCVATGGISKLSFNPTTGRLRLCRP